MAVDVEDLGIKLSPWVVVEAKDEHSTFAEGPKAGQIFSEKWRYVSADTEWFVGFDPATIRVRKVTYFEKPEQPSEDLIISLTEDDADILTKLKMLDAEELATNRHRLQSVCTITGDVRSYND